MRLSVPCVEDANQSYVDIDLRERYSVGSKLLMEDGYISNYVPLKPRETT
jgi:hypothetical protein